MPATTRCLCKLREQQPPTDRNQKRPKGIGLFLIAIHNQSPFEPVCIWACRGGIPAAPLPRPRAVGNVTRRVVNHLVHDGRRSPGQGCNRGAKRHQGRGGQAVASAGRAVVGVCRGMRRALRRRGCRCCEGVGAILVAQQVKEPAAGSAANGPLTVHLREDRDLPGSRRRRHDMTTTAGRRLDRAAS